MFVTLLNVVAIGAFILLGQAEETAALKPLAEAKYNYGEVLQKSILFYEAQRTGKLPADNRIKWRGDSFLNDGSDAGLDLSGGWFDAGDHMKFNFPMSSAVTVIAWGMIRFKEAYKVAGQWDNALSQIKWPLDYFMKCHSEDNVLFAQVGDGRADHSQWGRPEDVTGERPSYKITTSQPGSDLAGEVAAAMAAASIVFKEQDPAYSRSLLTHAEQLYNFAKTHVGLYSDSIYAARDFYRSSHYKDELAWAAAWLCKATEKESYLDEAKSLMDSLPQQTELSWNAKGVAAALMVYEADQSHTASKTYINRFIDYWLNRVAYTPKGLAWHNRFSPNKHAASASMAMLVAAELGIKPDECKRFAETQINYILGDGGRSYVTGFGTNPPKFSRHRAASCELRPAPCDWNSYLSPKPNPQVLNGALVGGPDRYDKFTDSRNNYVQNSVGLDYNSGFQSAVAGLLMKNMQ